jgi:GAF domain-containing protein
LCELANAVFGATACSIAALDEPAAELVYRASAGPGSELIVGRRLPLTAGIAGFVASTGQAIAVDDVRRDPRFAADVAASTGYVPTTLLVVPVTVADALVGVVSILDRQRAPGMGELERAAVVAEAAAPLLAFEVSLSRAGRVLLRAAADAADGDLATALRRAATRRRVDEADEAAQELTALATALAALRRLPPGRRAAAATAVSAVVALAESGSRRST